MTPLIWIIIIIALSLLLFFIELVVLPGITIAGITAFIGFCAGVAWIFSEYGLLCGFISLLTLLLIIGVVMWLFFRRKTWLKIALSTEIEGTIDSPLCDLCQIGDTGLSITRLAPVGNIEVMGKVFEGKSASGFISPQTPVIVTGYDNNTLIVKAQKNN